MDSAASHAASFSKLWALLKHIAARVVTNLSLVRQSGDLGPDSLTKLWTILIYRKDLLGLIAARNLILVLVEQVEGRGRGIVRISASSRVILIHLVEMLIFSFRRGIRDS